MKIQLTDTHPKIEEIMINLIREKTIPQKLSRVCALSSLALQLSKRAIKRANPNLNEQELNLLIIRYYYGEEFYKRVKKYLLELNDEKK